MRRTLTAPGVDGVEEVVVFESTPHSVHEYDVLGIEVAKGDYEALKVFYTKNKAGQAAAEEIPAVDEIPVVEEAPTVEEMAAIAEAPAVEDKLAADETPSTEVA
jgi:hypothetical protein